MDRRRNRLFQQPVRPRHTDTLTRDGVSQGSAGYSFDATGNTRQSYEQPLVFDAATDRLVSRVTTGGTHYYRYDRAGNLVTDSVPGVVVAQFNYDALDRLVSVVRNGVLIARYGYDVLGHRIVKRVYSNQTGGTIGYLRMVYTGSNVAFETDSAGTMGLRYTWGPGSDNLLAIQDESGNHYYATSDRLGSIRTLAKRDGTWLLTRRWDPYGNEMTRDSSASFTWGSRLRYGWTGREYDVELGMYYHRARYYSQSLRRFIQEDPVEGSTSPYAYVHGSPLEATDPSGMLDSYESQGFHEYCSIGTCINAYGGVTTNRQSYTVDGMEISMIAASGIPPDAIASAGYAPSLADWVWNSQRAVAGLVLDPSIVNDVARCYRESPTCAGLIREVHGFPFKTEMTRGSLSMTGKADGVTWTWSSPTLDGKWAIESARITIDPSKFAQNPWGTNTTVQIVHELGHVSWDAFLGSMGFYPNGVSEGTAEWYPLLVENQARKEVQNIYPNMKPYRDRY